MDLTTLTDIELDTLRRDCLIERERRATVASASERIRATVSEAITAGVTEQAVTAAVQDGMTPKQQAALRQE